MTRGKNFHRTLKWLRKTFIQTLYNIYIDICHFSVQPKLVSTGKICRQIYILIMIMIVETAIMIMNAPLFHDWSFSIVSN